MTGPSHRRPGPVESGSSGGDHHRAMETDRLASLLTRLTPDQRGAATEPPGPVLCVAPAGSGKTTTLVARTAWLVASSVDPATIAAITFNRRAAEDLRARLDPALVTLGIAPGTVRVRTFHALGLEILRSSGRIVDLVDRETVLRRLRPGASRSELLRLDTAISRLRLDYRVDEIDVAADPEPGPIGRAYLEYRAALRELGAMDFDDLVVEAEMALRGDPDLLARWRRACAHLMVDEAQDVDRSQLELALLLAAPDHRIFLVGDDDQSIYGWRLADVRRVLGLADRLAGLRRVDLVTNFRCPAQVVERATRLVAHNRERFDKRVLARPGATGRLVLAPDDREDLDRLARVLASWPEDGGSRAILTRTNRELLPAVVVAMAAEVPFRAPGLELPLEHPALPTMLAEARAADPSMPLLPRLAGLRTTSMGAPVPAAIVPAAIVPAFPANAASALAPPAPHDDHPSMGADPDPVPEGGLAERSALIGALLAWAPAFGDLEAFVDAIDSARSLLARLRRDDARLTLSTAHATKGLEFDHVAVVMDSHRFPSARSLADAAEPDRALEEERRLAYVAWTRARRTLTLVYDPAAPSMFLTEAFTPEELGTAPGHG
jgi:DNA helicase-2/ATP-dependent DNA helicase PcrA